MSYASWSVVANEQPSASKWNILGTNDASFNDGTGIANLAWNVTSLSNPYKFSAYRTTAWTTANGSLGKVAFDAELFDTNSNFDSVTNNRYVAPVNGFYQFNTSVGGTVTSGSYLILAFYVNGVATTGEGSQAVVSGATVDQRVNGCSFLQLTAADYVEVFFQGTGGAGDTGRTNTWFNGYLVSKT